MRFYQRFAALLALAGILFAQIAFAQVNLFTDNFNNGCTSLCLANGYNGWTVASTGANGGFANQWFVSCSENGQAPGTCGAGCGANATLHLGSVAGSPGGLCPSGDCGAAYDASDATTITHRRVQSPTVDCSGFNQIQLTYNYIAFGDPGNDFHTLEYSSNGGASWTTLGTGPTSLCCCSFLDCFFGCCAPTSAPCSSLRQGKWTTNTVNLPASADFNPNVKIGFNWVNNGDNLGTDPSFAVDELAVTGQTALEAGDLQLRGMALADGNRIEWEAQASRPVHKVRIFKSLDGVSFAELTSLPGFERTFQDGPGKAWYQVEMSLEDGKSLKSRVVEVGREGASELQLEIFSHPVPAGKPIRMALQTRISGDHLVQITDLKGRIIHSENFFLGAGSHELALSKTPWEAGIYLLVLKAGGLRLVQKVVIR
ncbi:MAG: T9SS type A sorting domain-containing protein [Bacteroidia bacterium]|nr:T9SS type A sorting domain-containing protein [Bacteroidia bacterium]